MELWQQLMFGALAILALWLFVPALKRSIKETPSGTAGDWLGVLLPIAAVVAFVILLILLV